VAGAEAAGRRGSGGPALAPAAGCLGLPKELGNALAADAQAPADLRKGQALRSQPDRFAQPAHVGAAAAAVGDAPVPSQQAGQAVPAG
jgi:hypothetical protein